MPRVDVEDAVGSWAASGGLWLTGPAAGPPLAAGAGAGAVAGHLLRLARRLVGGPVAADLPGVQVLGERAALADLARGGRVSCGGSTRMLPTADGHLVLTLARDDDLALVPALVEEPPVGAEDSWTTVGRWAAGRTGAEAAARVRLLGLAGAVVGGSPGAEGPAVRAEAGGPRRARERPRVLDLSSLWAGPLAAHVLGLAGADVVKVESARRLDGARHGERRFYDLLHAGHRSVVLDFEDRRQRASLQRLAAAADVVVEASRPRALARLGLDAEALVAGGVTWVSITAHGRCAGADRVGFGDDVAAGAGLVARDVDGGPMFVGDAVADPLTGLCAAVAALVSLEGPRARLLDIAMDRVSAVAARAETGPATVGQQGDGWVVDTPTGQHRVLPPQARSPHGVASPPGRETSEVLGEWLR